MVAIRQSHTVVVCQGTANVLPQSAPLGVNFYVSWQLLLGDVDGGRSSTEGLLLGFLLGGSGLIRLLRLVDVQVARPAVQGLAARVENNLLWRGRGAR
jgi:hypothetical protein